MGITRGGLEKDETFEQAALREASEELGITGLPIKFLWESETEFLHIDHLIHQSERFFLIEGKLPELLTNVQKVHEQEGILEMKWWSASEIELTNESIFPEELVLELKKINT